MNGRLGNTDYLAHIFHPQIEDMPEQWIPGTGLDLHAAPMIRGLHVKKLSRSRIFAPRPSVGRQRAMPRYRPLQDPMALVPLDGWRELDRLCLLRQPQTIQQLISRGHGFAQHCSDRGHSSRRFAAQEFPNDDDHEIKTQNEQGFQFVNHRPSWGRLFNLNPMYHITNILSIAYFEELDETLVMEKAE